MKLITALLPGMLLLACLTLPCTALESKFLAVAEKTISLDLGPGFELVRGESNASKSGMLSQDFVINNTDASGAAFVSVIGVYDETMSKMSPNVLSELFLMGGISAVEAKGAVEMGNWTAVDSRGKNVTVHTMNTNDESIEQLGSSYDIAVWNLDKPNFAVMVSLFDKNNTTQTIKTLTIN